MSTTTAGMAPPPITPITPTTPVAAATTAAQLTAYLAVRAERPARAFDWRGNNCCHFAAGWWHYATGSDPLAGLDSTADARAARRLVQRLGGSLVQAVAQQLGREPIAAALAQTGDVVLVPTAALLTAAVADEPAQRDGVGHVAGVCNGRHAVVMDWAGVAQFVPVELAEVAFRLRVAAGGS